MVGHISFNLMHPICKSIQKSDNSIKISVLGLTRPGGSIDSIYLNDFDEVLKSPIWSKKELLKKILTIRFLFKRVTSKETYTFRFLKNLKTKLLETAFSELDAFFYSKLFQKYDIINFQYIDNVSLKFLPYLSAKNKLVLTFWGSDLYLTSGISIYSKQLLAIKRADAVMLHSVEMREVFLAKYGRQFFSKIKLSLFGTEENKFKELDNLMNNAEEVTTFKVKNQLSKNKTLIMVGYNASNGNRHIQILESILKLSINYLNQIQLIFPLTYLKEEKYLEKLYKIIENNKERLDCIIFDKYLDNEEVGKLYNSIDIFFNLRETDALNGSMIECLYLGKVGFIGSWLPYSTLKKNDVQYVEIDEIEAVTEKLKDYLDNKNRIDINNNKNNVYKITCHKFTIPKWIAVYNDVLKN